MKLVSFGKAGMPHGVLHTIITKYSIIKVYEITQKIFRNAAVTCYKDRIKT